MIFVTAVGILSTHYWIHTYNPTHKYNKYLTKYHWAVIDNQKKNEITYTSNRNTIIYMYIYYSLYKFQGPTCTATRADRVHPFRYFRLRNLMHYAFNSKTVYTFYHGCSGIIGFRSRTEPTTTTRDSDSNRFKSSHDWRPLSYFWEDVTEYLITTLLHPFIIFITEVIRFPYDLRRT